MSHVDSRFPSPVWQVLSVTVHLLGVSILAHYISRRVRFRDVKSLHGLRQISWARFLTVLIFMDSWAFLFTGGILVHGTGMETSHTNCAMGIFSCIAFYATSKMFIWLFLAEKVHVVWSSPEGTPRFKSIPYILCVFLVMAYSAIGIHLCYERLAYFDEDGSCVIGLKPVGSILLLSYDIFINLILTGLFLWPLVRARIQNLYLRKVARRAVLASIFTLIASMVNVLSLTLVHGRELGWICLASCGLDVIANATVLFWVTSGSS
ncbi:hypothetical protein K474DRAFT_1604995, partial [Panus rudis PR-1116 ss-1]